MTKTKLRPNTFSNVGVVGKNKWCWIDACMVMSVLYKQEINK